MRGLRGLCPACGGTEGLGCHMGPPLIALGLSRGKNAEDGGKMNEGPRREGNCFKAVHGAKATEGFSLRETTAVRHRRTW